MRAQNKWHLKLPPDERPDTRSLMSFDTLVFRRWLESRGYSELTADVISGEVRALIGHGAVANFDAALRHYPATTHRRKRWVWRLYGFWLLVPAETREGRTCPCGRPTLAHTPFCARCALRVLYANSRDVHCTHPGCFVTPVFPTHRCAWHTIRALGDRAARQRPFNPGGVDEAGGWLEVWPAQVEAGSVRVHVDEDDLGYLQHCSWSWGAPSTRCTETVFSRMGAQQRTFFGLPPVRAPGTVGVRLGALLCRTTDTVQHLDGDSTNFRRANLRVVTHVD